MTYKVYPIIFSGPMVRALQAGEKTQTRRLVTSMWSNVKMHHDNGDRVLLYVRESYTPMYFDDSRHGYKADWNDEYDDMLPEPKWKPSIHMPRDDSRLTLEITDVRAQRLQDITEQDAQAEGCDPQIAGHDGWHGTLTTYRTGFVYLWNSLHGKPGHHWLDNPEVMALSFEVHQKNVDNFIYDGW